MKIIFVLLLLLPACATKITMPSGEEYKIMSKHNSLVVFEQEGIKITVDNRGRAGLIEQVFTGLLINTEEMGDSGKE